MDGVEEDGFVGGIIGSEAGNHGLRSIALNDDGGGAGGDVQRKEVGLATAVEVGDVDEYDLRATLADGDTLIDTGGANAAGLAAEPAAGVEVGGKDAGFESLSECTVEDAIDIGSGA